MKTIKWKINPDHSWRPKWSESRIHKSQLIKRIPAVLVLLLLSMTNGCRSYFEVKTSSQP